MHRRRAVDIRLGAVDLLLRVLDRRLVLLELILEFRDLEQREQLARGDAIADVHVDRLQVAGDLRVDVDLLERPELRAHR